MEAKQDSYTPWLGAYVDGELAGPLRAELEAHLNICETCRRELASHQSLSSLLQADPLPALSGSDERFAQQVLEQLPAPRRPLWMRLLQSAWRSVPLAIFAAWAMLQAVTWASGLLFLSGAYPADPLARPFGLLELLFTLLPDPITETALSLTGLAALNLWLTFHLALIFAGWLASWVAYQRRQAVTAG